MNTEIQRFIDHMGGTNKAAEAMGCNPDMLRKLRAGDRELNAKRIRQMHKLMPRISLRRLLEL